jgi:tripartite-type tricarboxylate transporter receptor subunit TctC
MKTGLMLFSMFLAFLYCPHFSMAAELNYPTKPIEIIIGYAPGAGTDLGARIIAEYAKKPLGQDVVCINKPGGAGRVGMTLVSKAKPDGYTLSSGTDSSIIVAPNLEEVSYKPLEDFVFMTQFGTLNFGVTVLQDSPFKTFKDMVEFARANPDKLTLGITGVNSSEHVAFQALALMENLKIRYVPFAGAAPAMTALLGGHVMAAIPATSGFASHVKSKTARLLAVLGETRMDEYSDAPTLKELGYPELVFQSWYIISGPKNIEKPIVKKLEETFLKAMETSEFIKMAKDLEMYTRKPLSGDELREGILRRNKRNAEIFKRLGIAIKK